MDRKPPIIYIIKLLIILVLPTLFIFNYFNSNDNSNLFYILLYFITISIYEFIFVQKRLLKGKLGSLICTPISSSKIINNSQNRNINNLDILLNDLRIKEDELETLHAASEILASVFDINSIMEYIYKVLNKYTNCDRMLISFIDKERNCLLCKYEIGDVVFGEIGKVFDGNLDISDNDENNFILRCYKSKKTLCKTNLFIQSRGIYGDKVAIPLNFQNEQGGVIFLESGVSGAFENINLGFLESLSNYSVIAIRNAELFNNIFIQKQEIEALYEETAAVNEELNKYIYDLNKTKEELKEKNDELIKYFAEIHTGYLQTVMTLANAIEAKDAYTRGHCQRVMELSCEIATHMGLTEDEISDLRYAAILHDIGKIGVSATIINKDGKLTEEEYNEIKKHPQISYNILKDIEFIKKGLDGILEHHERFDGRGYPSGIKGKEISMFGRILCIADAFDAMTSDRPYRKGMPMEHAIREIKRCRGAQFDPDIVDLFISMSKEIIPSIDQMQGEIYIG
jgi:HD-GYP domain-containing protein (c-di-GMP phosphodiesterase class II)